MGSIEISNKLKAMGSVAGATGAMVSGAGANSSQSGVGVYPITIGDSGLDAAECVCLATRRGTTGGSIAIEQTSDDTKTVRTFDATGNAANADFDFAIFECPAGITP